jgi:triosephosphate isomerase
MKRQPILAGNWKMHGTLVEAQALARGLAERAGRHSDRQVILAPPFTALATVLEEVRETQIKVAAQNMHWEAKGAFTGEVAGPMLRELGVEHVILGHSERREIFGETDEVIRKKVAFALDNDMTVILCVGETLAQRDANETLSVVTGQVKAALSGIEGSRSDHLILAYEPVWAIGTGRVATREQAQEVHAEIRGCLGDIGLAAAQMRILYGGSVKPDNIDGLMAEPDIDGALVGGASLDVEAFTRIVDFRA